MPGKSFIMMSFMLMPVMIQCMAGGGKGHELGDWRIALAARGDVTKSNDSPDFSHSDTANSCYGLPLLLSFVLVDGSTSTSQQQFSCQR